MSILTNKTFLITTLLFLVLAVASIWLFFPPVLTSYNGTREESTELSDTLSALQSKVDSLSSLSSDEDSLDEYHSLANSALPTSPQPDILMLQLEGLTNSLGLDATITLPFNGASVVSQQPAASTNGVSIGGSTTTASSNSETQFTVAGDFDFNTTRSLIQKLDKFIRWNSVTSINISASNGKATASITGRTYWLAKQADERQLPANILEKAKTVFDDFQSYTTIPDISTEGDFGRNDPFAQ